MNYISTTQAAKKWGISSSRVLKLIKSGRIPEAIQIGYHWMIPDNLNKPIDARTNTKIDDTFFRYPLFEGRDIDSFNPPLSNVELLIKETSEAFHSCQIEKSEELINKLLEMEMYPYQKAFVLYAACIIYASTNKIKDFFLRYGELETLLNSDFPRRKEMSYLINEIDLNIGINKFKIDTLNIDSSYKYHESYLPHLAAISIESLCYKGSINLNSDDYAPYEFLCALYDDKGYNIDSQTMHFHLGIVYGYQSQIDKMKYHLSKFLEISYKYHLYYLPSVMYYYYAKPIESVLKEFPNELSDIIHKNSIDAHNRYLRFTEATSSTNIYSLLESNDYIYLFCIIQGYSNKEIAKITHVSEGSIANRLSAIYQTLGIKNRAELVEFYNTSVTNPIIQK